MYCNHCAARISFFVDFDHFGFPIYMALLVFVYLVILVGVIFQRWQNEASLRRLRRHVRLFGLFCIFLQQSLIDELVSDHTGESKRIYVFA